MSKIHRLYETHKILKDRRTPISLAELVSRVGVDDRSIHRYLADLKDNYGAVIESKNGGYVMKKPSEIINGMGLWLSARSMEWFLFFHVVAQRMSDSAPQLIPDEVKQNIDKYFRKRGKTRSFPTDKVRILASHRRKGEHTHLVSIVSAILDQEVLLIEYESRSQGAQLKRPVSVQRLVYYKDHWYIDGYDHESNELRVFSVDRIRKIEEVEENSLTFESIDEDELEQVLRSGYGIFSGKEITCAKLRFSQKIAPWIRDETWHSNQKSVDAQDGSFILEVPYSDSTELIGEILRYGPEVEVLEPSELRSEVQNRIRGALELYT